MLNRILNNIKYRIRGEVSTERYIKRGLIVGRNFSRQQGCSLDFLFPWLIKIGDDVTLAPGVNILAHDASTKKYLGYSKIGNVNIGDRVFIGMNSTILPGITIGNDVIIGANSLVCKDIPNNCVASGNPAKIICTMDDYLIKNKKIMKERFIYDDEWPMYKNITDEQKEKMREYLKNGISYAK